LFDVKQRGNFLSVETLKSWIRVRDDFFCLVSAMTFLFGFSYDFFVWFQLQAKRNEDHAMIRKLKEEESKVADLLKKIQHLETLLQSEAQQHQNSRMMAEQQLRQKDEEIKALTISLSQKIEEEKALHAQTEEKFKNFANSLQGRENHIKVSQRVTARIFF